MKEVDFSILRGKVITNIGGAVGDGEMTFYCNDGSCYKLYHAQDCCESVGIEDIIGDLKDLIGIPILDAREETNLDHIPALDGDDSYTWTFYILATNKGYATIRWYGTSNGYYSEQVDFAEVIPPRESNQLVLF